LLPFASENAAAAFFLDPRNSRATWRTIRSTIDLSMAPTMFDPAKYEIPIKDPCSAGLNLPAQSVYVQRP
jgi:hypothetical protein